MKENLLEIKKHLYLQCQDAVNNRFETVQRTMKEIQESLLSETKSTAGDKHETGRAMLQLEREKAGNQLAEIQKIIEVLSKIDVSKTLNVVGLGSLIYTSQANYFIAVSTGELIAESRKFYAISPNTPIGKLLLGKSVGDTIEFRGQRILLNEII